MPAIVRDGTRRRHPVIAGCDHLRQANVCTIADYIALDKRSAAADLVQRVFARFEQMGAHPDRGSKPAELGKKSRYRQLVEPPCRVFYRFDGERVFILHVMRSERLLREDVLASREKEV